MSASGFDRRRFHRDCVLIGILVFSFWATLVWSLDQSEKRERERVLRLEIAHHLELFGQRLNEELERAAGFLLMFASRPDVVRNLAPDEAGLMPALEGLGAAGLELRLVDASGLVRARWQRGRAGWRRLATDAPEPAGACFSPSAKLDAGRWHLAPLWSAASRRLPEGWPEALPLVRLGAPVRDASGTLAGVAVLVLRLSPLLLFDSATPVPGLRWGIRPDRAHVFVVRGDAPGVFDAWPADLAAAPVRAATKLRLDRPGRDLAAGMEPVWEFVGWLPPEALASRLASERRQSWTLLVVGTLLIGPSIFFWRRNIERRRMAQLSLAETNERLSFLLDQAPVLLYRGRIREGMPLPEEFHGRHPRWTPRRHPDPEGWWDARIHPEDREKVRAHLEATLAEGGREFVHRFRMDAGSHWRWIEEHIRFDPEGERCYGCLIDIDEIRRAEARLAEMRDELGRNLIRLQAAHDRLRADLQRWLHDDLGQGLSAIRNIAEALAERLPEGDAARARLNTVREAADAMLSGVRRRLQALKAPDGDRDAIPALRGRLERWAEANGVAFSWSEQKRTDASLAARLAPALDALLAALGGVDGVRLLSATFNGGRLMLELTGADADDARLRRAFALLAAYNRALGPDGGIELVCHAGGEA